MINIIGNIKVDESNPDRIQYFFATLLSFKFIPGVKICIGLNDQSHEFVNKVQQCLIKNFAYPYLSHSKGGTSYKNVMFDLFEQSDKEYKYYINFEEDHFCILNNYREINFISHACEVYGVDMLRLSYFQIETKSAENVYPITDNHEKIKVFRMDEENYKKFQDHYTRFYLGVNAMFKIDYAKRLYDRPGTRPHDFELSAYNKEFEYTCAVPKIEILRSIDNDHEAIDSCLLKNPTDKFLECMETAKQYM